MASNRIHLCQVQHVQAYTYMVALARNAVNYIPFSASLLSSSIQSRIHSVLTSDFILICNNHNNQMHTFSCSGCDNSDAWHSYFIRTYEYVRRTYENFRRNSRLVVHFTCSILSSSYLHITHYSHYYLIVVSVNVSRRRNVWMYFFFFGCIFLTQSIWCVIRYLTHQHSTSYRTHTHTHSLNTIELD